MKAKDFSVTVVGQQEWNALDDNIDIEVKFRDGRRYTATVFTVKNIETLFAKNKATGECGNGLYLWAVEMIVVETLSYEVLNLMVQNLIDEQEFESAFARVPDEGSIMK